MATRTRSSRQSCSAEQIIVTGADSYAQFQVSDGSTFEVFSNAKVVFRDNTRTGLTWCSF